MASPSTVITLGYGSFGSVNLLPTLGYGSGSGIALVYGPLTFVAEAFVPGFDDVDVFVPCGVADVTVPGGSAEIDVELP